MNKLRDRGAPAVRDLVLGSWQRSEAGDRLGDLAHAPSLSGAEFDRVLGGNDRLRAAAEPVLRRFGAMLGDSDAMLLLCDPEGVVMDAAGASHVRQRGERNNLQPGGRWCESAIGTNAIGTALHLRQPVTISGAEHYCEAIRQWACAAVPLHDPADGALMGVIDVSGAPGAGFGTAGALAASTASQIEQILRTEDIVRHRDLIDALLSDRRGGHGEEVMLLDRFGQRVWSSEAFGRAMREAGGPEPEMLSRIAASGRDAEAESWADNLRQALPGADIDLLQTRDGALGLVVRLRSATGQRRPVAPEEERLSLKRIAQGSRVLAPLCVTARKFYFHAVPLTVEGAAGTGKRSFARALHFAGASGNRPFEMLDCTSLEAEQLQSDLRDGGGLLAQRDRGGTLCLSEPARTPAAAQPALAQALERLGRGGRVPVQVIALSTEPLSEAVAQGRLLRDLQLRCAGSVIRLPGLVARREEVPVLLRHFAAEMAAEGRRPLRFTAAALERLRAHDWPGNLWEMRNLVQALEAEHAGEGARVIDLSDLPQEVRGGVEAEPQRLQDCERELIARAVSEAGGNLSRASKRLGIARSTLYLKLDQYGLRG
ncbi:sigma-54-dependent Fis family transcriptional regulator [Pseudodonghicola xiamenensis]|uniref:Sigma-54-dependent Fis family transcriptional regulator n=1 Tax=Pseudodonghicola xiamenensis TaxID=337702 RepID=A0A8J3HAS0_9RHOB|nr:GAF domain-containing protein [Pseudodonghicola xiamenensis]GHG98509.1 sigma-54-dependent Fis family transcriptional regulator [Pseudodonghicola xiamenensis]